MKKSNWILFGISLLIFLYVIGKRISRHFAKPEHRVAAETFNVPDASGALTGNYGYVVKIDQDTIIRQTYLPIFPGRVPFSSQEDALRTGECVARRVSMHPNELPALTVEDLDSLHVKHP